MLSFSDAAQSLIPYETTNPSTKLDGSNKTTANGNYFGFTFSFQNTPNALTTQNGSAVPSGSLPSQLTLDSFSLFTRSSSTSAETGAFKIALCVFTANGTAGPLIALSNNSQVSTGSSAAMNFTFDNGVTLNTSDMIQVIFVNQNTTAETWNWEQNRLTKGVGLSLLNSESALPTGVGLYKNNTLSSWEGFYLPRMSISTHVNESVPEPASATLGLLGLAGLMIVRRRA